jgi:aryl-alcohol dehydrogenase-like predicted oxidoreductase
MGHGPLVGPGGIAPAEAMGWALSQPGVSLSIIGCATPEEVHANAKTARSFRPLPSAELAAIEARASRLAGVASSFKRS